MVQVLFGMFVQPAVSARSEAGEAQSRDSRGYDDDVQALMAAWRQTCLEALTPSLC